MKAGELKRKITHDLYLSLHKDVADDILEKVEQYAQQVREDEAIAFVMWFEQDEKSTSKFAYKIEYKRFKNHQNQER